MVLGKMCGGLIGSTALAWVRNGAATADQETGTNYLVR
jgi:hypothetical protein